MRPIPSHRQGVRTHSQRLRRARSLYVHLCKRAIETDDSGQVLKRCARRMIESGMLAMPCEKSARFSILRRMCKADGYTDNFGWHRWIWEKGWRMGSFDRNPLWKKEVA